MNPALLYLRVSTARQANRGGEPEGYSLPAQREACARKASELGAEVVGEFVDAGASARSVDRPGLQALIERLADKSLPAVGYVIVHKLDRLARDRADDVSVLLAIRAAGAELVSVSEQIDATPAGMLLHGIMASIAEFYSRNLSEEAKTGLSEKAKRGGTIGYAPTGYLNTTERVLGDDGISREAKTVIPDPSRAPHISWAFAEYARGELSLSDLTVALAARGLTSRDSRAAGKALSRASVHRMLSNPYYVGKVVHRGVQYDGKHEPLVDPATFAKVQDMLAGRKIAGDRAWRRTHYLKGTVVCARCGSRLGYSHNRGSGGVYEYFFCLGRAKKRTDCDLPYLSAAGVEDGVLALWQRQTLTPDDVERARRAADMELAAMTTRQSRDLRAARGDVERLTATKQRLLDAYLAEALTLTDFQAKQSDLAAQLTSAQSRLDDLTQDTDRIALRLELVLSLMARAGEFYEACPDDARGLLNHAVFTSIAVGLDDETHGQPNEVVEAVVAMAHEGSVGTTAHDSAVQPDLAVQTAQAPNEGATSLHRANGANSGTHGYRAARAGRAARNGHVDAANPGHEKNSRRALVGRDGSSNVNYLAVAVGFEPTVGLHPHTLSRSAP